MWYVIQVRTDKEMEIAESLKEQGIRALVPRENRLIRSGGSWTQKVYVLFSGYVFLDMRYSAETYYKVKRVPGVVQFLGDARSPSTLSYLEAEWIRLLAGKDNAPIEPATVQIRDDGSVRILDGVLLYFENRMLKYDKRNRKATFEITVCGEKKEVQLSIRLDTEKESTIKSGGSQAEDGKKAEMKAEEAT